MQTEMTQPLPRERTSPASRPGRRKGERSPFHADVELSGPSEANGTVLERGAGGFRVALDETVEVGKCFRVVLRTPEDEVSRTFAQVVWCGSQGFDYVAGLALVD